MRRIAISCAVAFFLIGLCTDGFADPPIPLTDCRTITQRGNYVLENDLVTSQGGNCLVINSSHVNVDLNGQTITCVLAGMFPCPIDSLEGIGIDIEADHVSISNGTVERFAYGIVGGADHISATNLALATHTGIVLNDVSHSAFSDIRYVGTGVIGPETDGPVLSVSGGGKNTFTSINSPAFTFEGVIITNSSNNVIEEVDIGCAAEGKAGPGVLLTQESNNNFIANSNIFVLFGNGIEVDSDSNDNVIQNDTVETATTQPEFFALLDQNPDCGSNVWTDNTFSNIFMPGEISASPASCIH
jgi:hypothetical protein